MDSNELDWEINTSHAAAALKVIDTGSTIIYEV